MDTNEFKSTILNHQGGFLLSSGDQNGDCSLSMSFNDVFFDSAEMLGESWLSFKNKLDEKEVDGKMVGSVYAFGTASIDLQDVKSIEEYGDYYLIENFSVGVKRMFTIKLTDVGSAVTWLCIGLL